MAGPRSGQSRETYSSHSSVAASHNSSAAAAATAAGVAAAVAASAAVVASTAPPPPQDLPTIGNNNGVLSVVAGTPAALRVYSASIRWWQLSATFFLLSVLDSQRRTITPFDFAGFLDLVSWRARGKLAEEEFSAVLNEWMTPSNVITSPQATSSNSLVVGSQGKSRNGRGANTPSTGSISAPSGSSAVLTLQRTRLLLCAAGVTESELDLYIGMLVHSTNSRLLHTPIAYARPRSQRLHLSMNNPMHSDFSYPNEMLSPGELETVTTRWLALSEELFFALDTPGYGSWRFDEAFFFISCITVGLQAWNSASELEADLSLTTLTALTIQFLRECGAPMPANATPHTRGVAALSLLSTVSGRQEVTLVALKRYLIRKAVPESELAILVNYVKAVVDGVARLAYLHGAADLYGACQPIEQRGAVVGSPRLWQEAVMLAAGFPAEAAMAAHRAAATSSASDFENFGATYGNSRHSPTGQGPSSSMPTVALPPILLFLLADGERLIPGCFRAIEFAVGDGQFLNSTISNDGDSSQSGGGWLYNSEDDLAVTNPLLCVPAANAELYDCAYRIWAAFRRWTGEVSGSAAPSLVDAAYARNGGSNGGLPSQASFRSFAPPVAAEIQRDVVFQLVLAGLLQFKRLQTVSVAAVFDFAVQRFGLTPAAHRAAASASGNPYGVANEGLAAAGVSESSFSQEALAVLCAALLPVDRDVLVEFGLAAVEIDENVYMTATTGGGHASIYSGHHDSVSVQESNQYDWDDVSSPAAGSSPAHLNSATVSRLMTSPRHDIPPVPPMTSNTPPKSSNSVSGKEDHGAGLVDDNARRISSSRVAVQRRSQKSTPSNTYSLANGFYRPTITSQRRAEKNQANIAAAAAAAAASAAEEAAYNARRSPPRATRRPSGAAVPARSSNALTVESLERRNVKHSIGSALPTAATNVGQGKNNSTSSKIVLGDEEAKILSELEANDPESQNELTMRLRSLKLTQSVSSTTQSSSETNHQPTSQPANPNPRTSSRSQHHESPISVGGGDEENSVLDGYLSEASSTPSSIGELWAAGHPPARYAQMLRDLLRRMSREDGDLKVKSLERVLALGQELVDRQDLKRRP